MRANFRRACRPLGRQPQQCCGRSDDGRKASLAQSDSCLLPLAMASPFSPSPSFRWASSAAFAKRPIPFSLTKLRATQRELTVNLPRVRGWAGAAFRKRLGFPHDAWDHSSDFCCLADAGACAGAGCEQRACRIHGREDVDGSNKRYGRAWQMRRLRCSKNRNERCVSGDVLQRVECVSTCW